MKICNFYFFNFLGGKSFEIPETEGSLIMNFYFIFPNTQNQWFFEISKQLPNIGL
jgi:hypothetical protein